MVHLNPVSENPKKTGFYTVVYSLNGKLFQANVYYDEKAGNWRTPEYHAKNNSEVKGWIDTNSK